MKAIIPVAGAGTKLRPHTYTQPKALIPLAGKTILSIIVDQLHEAGIHEFIFIVGYLGEKIQDYVKDKYPHLTAHFVYQNERYGIGHAILLTKEIVGDDEIFIVLGDTICEFDVKQVLETPHSTLGVKRVDDPRNFGVAEIDDHGAISRVVEKPQIPKSNMALVGIYLIRETSFLFTCLQNNIQNQLTSYGEYNLTDAIECMIKNGAKFHSFKVQNWFDCGKKETLLEGADALCDNRVILTGKVGDTNHLLILKNNENILDTAIYCDRCCGGSGDWRRHLLVCVFERGASIRLVHCHARHRQFE